MKLLDLGIVIVLLGGACFGLINTQYGLYIILAGLVAVYVGSSSPEKQEEKVQEPEYSYRIIGNNVQMLDKEGYVVKEKLLTAEEIKMLPGGKKK